MRRWLRSAADRIQATVGRDQVQTAVSIKVAHIDPVPTTRELVQSPLTGAVPQSPLVSGKDPEGAPFTGQDQFGRAIAIQIGPDSSSHQTDFAQRLAILFI